jgi:putative hydrolase of the HAD superfamily
LYIVTDGNKTVQKNKLIALGLHEMVKFCFITHRYSIRHAKPSPYCFLKICEREKVAAEKVVYIGDNPHKDFVGIKPFGFKTIRIKKGQYEDIVKSDEFEAKYCMNSISELSLDMLANIFSN